MLIIGSSLLLSTVYHTLYKFSIVFRIEITSFLDFLGIHFSGERTIDDLVVW